MQSSCRGTPEYQPGDDHVLPTSEALLDEPLCSQAQHAALYTASRMRDPEHVQRIAQQAGEQSPDASPWDLSLPTACAELALFYQGLLTNPGNLWDPDVLADATGNVRNVFPDPWFRSPANRTLGLVVAGDDGYAHMRMNFGRTVSARAFGHAGAGGQIAWADPASGLSFCYFTNGLDAHVLRQARRGLALSSRAAVVCA